MPRGQTPAASAQQQRDTSSTSDKSDISLKEEEIWNTNDQLFPEWYPTLIRALREGPIKFQLYFERLTTMEKHLVCCIDNNHVKAMQEDLIGTFGTIELPLLKKDIPKVPVPPTTPHPSTGAGTPSGSQTLPSGTPTVQSSPRPSRFTEAPESVDRVSREIISFICDRISYNSYCKKLREKYTGTDGAAQLMHYFLGQVDHGL